MIKRMSLIALCLFGLQTPLHANDICTVAVDVAQQWAEARESGVPLNAVIEFINNTNANELVKKLSRIVARDAYAEKYSNVSAVQFGQIYKEKCYSGELSKLKIRKAKE